MLWFLDSVTVEKKRKWNEKKRRILENILQLDGTLHHRGVLGLAD